MPQVLASSTNASSPERAMIARCGSPVGPTTSTVNGRWPVSTRAATLPSPPSAMGTVMTLAAGRPRLSPVASASHAARAVTEPFSLSIATTTVGAGPAVPAGVTSRWATVVTRR